MERKEVITGYASIVIAFGKEKETRAVRETRIVTGKLLHPVQESFLLFHVPIIDVLDIQQCQKVAVGIALDLPVDAPFVLPVVDDDAGARLLHALAMVDAGIVGNAEGRVQAGNVAGKDDLCVGYIEFFLQVNIDHSIIGCFGRGFAKVKLVTVLGSAMVEPIEAAGQKNGTPGWADGIAPEFFRRGYAVGQGGGQDKD